jgi:hypothetical protein
MWHAWERGENCLRFWLKIPKEKDNSKDRGVDGIRIALMEIGWEGGVHSDGSVWGPVVDYCRHGDEPIQTVHKR